MIVIIVIIFMTIKVLEFSLSVSDCDKGLSVDPNNGELLLFSLFI